MSSFGRPVCSVAEWVPHSVVFASGVDSVCVPLANEGVGLVPVASCPPLGIGQLRRPCSDSFHLGVFMRWSSTYGGLASGSSGSRTSRYGLLVYVQGASDSLPHSSPGGEVVASVSGIAVQALLLAMSIPLGMVVSLAPGRCLSVSTFYGLFSILKVFVLKCRVLPFS